MPLRSRVRGPRRLSFVTLKRGDAALRADHDTLVYTYRKINSFRKHAIAYSSNLQAYTPDTYRLRVYSARRSGSVVRVV